MSARKPAHELSLEEKKLLVLKISELRELIKGLGIEEHRQRFEEQKKQDKKELADLQSSIASARTLLNDVLKDTDSFRELGEKHRADTKLLIDRHGDISRRLLVDLSAKQKKIDEADAILQGIDGSILNATKRLTELNEELRRQEQVKDERDALMLIQSKQLESLARQISEALAEKESILDDSKQHRQDNLNAEAQRREAGILLHDARAYKDRMKPEFQKLLKNYLDKHHG